MAAQVLEGLGPAFGSMGSEAVDRVLAGIGKRRRVVFEVYDGPAIMDFIARGLGVALAPASSAASRPDVRAIPLVDPAPTWTFGGVVSCHHASSAARALSPSCRSSAPQVKVLTAGEPGL